MNHSQKRRFIAGAVCPRCSSMDTIMMFQDEGVDVRKCVECDFEEKATFDDNKPALKNAGIPSAVEKELPTRVNKDLLEVGNGKKKEVSQEKSAELQIIKIIGSETTKKN